MAKLLKILKVYLEARQMVSGFIRRLASAKDTLAAMGGEEPEQTLDTQYRYVPGFMALTVTFFAKNGQVYSLPVGYFF